MNKEILFRGQTRRKGEKVRLDGMQIESNWVYGCGVFVANDDRAIIYQSEPEFKKHTVYCETVCQYTGLTDKNGVKIFEGDIINIRGNSNYDDYKSINYNALVTFVDGAFCAIDAISEDECSVKRYNFYRREYEIEVIGNIYDNPELLTNENNDRSENDFF